LVRPPMFLLAMPAASALAAEPIDYLRDINPILKERCYSCHGALKQKASLRLDTVAAMTKGGKSGPAIKGGDAAASLLIKRVNDPDESSCMPPEGQQLADEQIAKLKAWIDEVAKVPGDERGEQ